ncbi:MAG TPA: hypothetical protein VGF06_10665, partial [Terriglobales bacterium]
MKILLRILLLLGWGLFLLLSALYCLLAYLPYTFAAVIKAPPYEWVPWFVHHQVLLYWMGMGGVAFSCFPGMRRKPMLLLFAVLAAIGVYMAIRPPLPALRDDSTAFAWSALFLVLIIATAGIQLLLHEERSGPAAPGAMLAYSTAIAAALLIAGLWLGGIQLRNHAETGTLISGLDYAELAVWSLLSHSFVAVILISLLNLIRKISDGRPQAATIRRSLVGVAAFAALGYAIVLFLDNALAFSGPRADVYAALLSASIVLLGSSCGLGLLNAPAIKAVSRRKLSVGLLAGLVALPTLLLPQWIGGGDWNGIIQHSCALILWLALGICAYWLRPRPAQYSLAAILAVLVLGIFTYKALQATAILWGKPLGPTDSDVAAKMQQYASRDASFDLVHHILGNGASEPCADLCRIMRQYSNIPDFAPQTEVNLVSALQPAQGARPNIFIFIIDSMRPDYLGAYNRQVDFTPNLDAFAGDSI